MTQTRFEVVMAIAAVILSSYTAETKPTSKQPVVPPLMENKDFILGVLQASSQCPGHQFLSDGSGACEECSTHCTDKMATQNCLQQCQEYFINLKMKKLGDEIVSYKKQSDDSMAVMTKIIQYVDGIKAARKCSGHQFFSDGSGACEDCSTHCVAGTDTQNCAHQCHDYFTNLELERLRNEAIEYKEDTSEELQKLMDENKKITQTSEQKYTKFIIILVCVCFLALLLGSTLPCVYIRHYLKTKGQEKKDQWEPITTSTETISAEGSINAFVQESPPSNRTEAVHGPSVSVHVGQGSVQIG